LVSQHPRLAPSHRGGVVESPAPARILGGMFARPLRIVALALLVLVFRPVVPTARGATSLHTTWLWHLHQPVYWPDRRSYGPDHYEAAWDTIQQQDAGRPHPAPEVLRNIFGVDDRKAAYQSRPRDTLAAIGGHLNSGAQVSYSGALMENVQSLGAAGQLGYGSTWNQPNRTARGWTTTDGKPRMDLVNFTYHHALAPLLTEETLEMELRIHKRQMEIFWGTNPPPSRGWFPTETCFSTRLIPVLKRVGIDWSVVANSHLSRACADFPLVIGSGGENCDIPNRADQLNPAQGASNYKRLTIDRGISPAAAMPFAYQLHWARHVDPETGAESRLILVPSDQALGWKDSYSSWDLNLMNDLRDRNDPARPALVMFAHDGDNAWSGGFSYYNEWVPNFTGQAAGRGYEPTTVEQFLVDHAPASNDVVHIEDGGWVYADGDFGSPIFVNWHWPPSRSAGGVNVVDPSLGTSDKADNWRVILATENRVKTAQQIAGVTPRIDQVRDPSSYGQTPNGVELGWHYYLGGLDSGFVYYGCHDDECQRAAAAQSNAVRNVNPVIAGNPAADATPPTIFLPQRHPWNPGGTNFGVQYSYRLTVATNTDFWVWTYGYDVSGISNATLFIRANGTNPPTQDQFKTYAGGPQAGAWQSLTMTHRVVAPVIGVTPQYLADYYYSRVTGLSNVFADYYVSATDTRGNTFKSPIQHVWIGGNVSGGTPSTNPPPTPQNLVVGSVSSNRLTLSWSVANGASAYRVLRSGTNLAVTTATAFTDSNLQPATAYCYAVLATNAHGTSTPSAQVCATTTTPSTNAPSQPPFVMDGSRDFTNYLWSVPAMQIYAALRGSTLYVATWSPGNSGPSDHFIFVTDTLSPTATNNAPWAKSGKTAAPAGKPFLAAESQGTYIAWYHAPASSAAAKSAVNSAQMEGTINLAAAFGAVPPVIYLAAAAYATANGGTLQSLNGTGTGPDIDPGEFLALPTAALRDHNADGLFDRLDPLLDFRVQRSARAGTNVAVDFASMPNRAYQLSARPGFSLPWQDVAGMTRTGGPLDISLSFTNPLPVTATQQFYRVRLLP
jgi:hypothetical protein